MSDKEWYTNLSRYELEGKHVHVLFSDGTMEGSLNLLGQIVYWKTDVGLKHVQILDWNKDRTWTRAVGVESVSMVWDERDWQELGPAEYRKADAIVVNGRFLQVTRVMRNAFLVGDRDPVPVPFVSCALRHKAKLPTEPGIYRGADGTLLIRLKSLLEADIWMYVSKDFLEDGAYVGDEVARKYLPLTPVHFVDGRAE